MKFVADFYDEVSETNENNNISIHPITIGSTPTRSNLDTDVDGILDNVDDCPTQKETFNGFEDSDGCPDVNPNSQDTDGDGIINLNDQCPTQAETFNGFEDSDGCPDVNPNSQDTVNLD